MGAQFIDKTTTREGSPYFDTTETLEQKSRIKRTVRSDLNSQAIPKRFGSVFSREFMS
ncbi:hypothetical protein DPMN_167857 [Dreissena polymorpha]|uniref:Uncharacterized protein n=1 Tax=Dreissena polymorpha TaxID=45954 RepID=A0A9D4F411_DREPO|nr:hypothetical protein DPMN_167857 [Dreissena polymorpha]